MQKRQKAKEIARLFEDKICDTNLISDIFDYLQFDCKIRAFIDPNKLDESTQVIISICTLLSSSHEGEWPKWFL